MSTRIEEAAWPVNLRVDKSARPGTVVVGPNLYSQVSNFGGGSDDRRCCFLKLPVLFKPFE